MTVEPSAPLVERRHDDFVGVGTAKRCLWSAVGLTVLMVLVGLVLVLLKPETLEQQPVRYMGYFLAAIIVALFAGAGINVVNILNGHQAMLMRAVAEKERAQGKLEGLKENPDINIS